MPPRPAATPAPTRSVGRVSATSATAATSAAVPTDQRGDRDHRYSGQEHHGGHDEPDVSQHRATQRGRQEQCDRDQNARDRREGGAVDLLGRCRDGIRLPCRPSRSDRGHRVDQPDHQSGDQTQGAQHGRRDAGRDEVARTRAQAIEQDRDGDRDHRADEQGVDRQVAAQRQLPAEQRRHRRGRARRHRREDRRGGKALRVDPGAQQERVRGTEDDDRRAGPQGQCDVVERCVRGDDRRGQQRGHPDDREGRALGYGVGACAGR